jgi:hypothetical protein
MADTWLYVLLFIFSFPLQYWLLATAWHELTLPSVPKPGKPNAKLLKSLRGKVVLITGASQGIGRELANIYAGHGCKIVIASRGEAKLKEVKQGMVETWGATRGLRTAGRPMIVIFGRCGKRLGGGMEIGTGFGRRKAENRTWIVSTRFVVCVGHRTSPGPLPDELSV